MLGLALGWAASLAVAAEVERQTGLHVASGLGWGEFRFAFGLVAAGSLFSLMPALAAWRVPVSEGLRS
jgi:hypothetical protein